MISVSLVPYVSNHDLNNVSVDGLAYRDFCLQFKSGHDWATKKAAMMVGDGLKRNNMKNVVFLCQTIVDSESPIAETDEDGSP